MKQTSHDSCKKNGNVPYPGASVPEVADTDGVVCENFRVFSGFDVLPRNRYRVGMIDALYVCWRQC